MLFGILLVDLKMSMIKRDGIKGILKLLAIGIKKIENRDKSPAWLHKEISVSPKLENPTILHEDNLLNM